MPSSPASPLRAPLAMLLMLLCGSCTTEEPSSTRLLDDDPDTAALRQSLAAALSDGQLLLPYRDLWEVLIEGAALYWPGSGFALETPVQLFYTRRIAQAGDWARGDRIDDPDGWQREHLWPVSYGLEGSLTEFDLHNVVPADASVNRARSNRYFDIAPARHEECGGCGAGSDTWEPPPEVQGDVARVMFYMDLRYNGNRPLGEREPELSLSDRPDPLVGEFGRLSALQGWHRLDPISEEEVQRHEAVASHQGNRNLLVDSPVLMESAYGFSCATRVPSGR